MKRVTTTLAVLALVFGVALAQPSPGGPGAPGGPGMPPTPMMGMADKPGIPDMTPEQMGKIDAMRVAHMKTVMPIQTDIQVAEIELDALWRADEPDAKKIIAKVKEIGDLRQKLEVARVTHHLDMLKLMTPDQRKAMKKMGMGPGMKGKGMGRRMRGMGHGMKGGMKGAGSQGQMGQCDPQSCKDCMMH
jgi:Spy/CpxP family protein refolding chaperone